ncbi:TetR/AcrR family transcriptional regulator [Altererythrobacter sp. BO-6]|uniref:TetR/AcrR family transcriptional regulator n=1 Tax=Altererythrobacter sp. BO-6 TaxID=2604537 RepID=UPI0013E106E6|nr:TetR/AcrR family transcriptional regulator [Altererythrobacter sp. BO-6]QIG54757.1 TetR/AcrR family transcriptional regulator [Altererythrobacter sp. BO-6]
MTTAARRKSTSIRKEIAAFKRQRILEVASELFARHGYELTTLDEVAARIEVTKPFIYSYYRNKGELLREICERGIRKSTEALDEVMARPASPTDQLHRIVRSVGRIIVENRDYIAVYQAEEKNLLPEDAKHIREMRHEFDLKLTGLLERGQEAGEFEIQHAQRSALWIGGLLTWIANWYHEGGKWSADEIIEDAVYTIDKIVMPLGESPRKVNR